MVTVAREVVPAAGVETVSKTGEVTGRVPVTAGLPDAGLIPDGVEAVTVVLAGGVVEGRGTVVVG